MYIFVGELQHAGLVGEQKIKWWPIRTWEIAGVRLLEELYVNMTIENLRE